MSSYLIERIEATENITLHTRTEVVATHGESHLEGLEWRSRSVGAADNAGREGGSKRLSRKPSRTRSYSTSVRDDRTII
ncbi:MAG: hypothetical protein AAF735_06315 [Myxococcota bacterium]